MRRVDAVVAGDELGLPLAEELAAPRAVRHRQPRRHAARARRPLQRPAHRWGRATSTCASPSPPAPPRRAPSPSAPRRSTARTRSTRRSRSSSTSTTAASSRACCCATRGPARRRRSSSSASPAPAPGAYLAAALAGAGAPAARRARSSRATCARRCATGAAAGSRERSPRSSPPASPCSSSPPTRRARRDHLRAILGGFALCSHDALERDPSLARIGGVDAHVVMLDPPAGPLRTYGAMTHLAWGPPELRFAASDP